MIKTQTATEAEAFAAYQGEPTAAEVDAMHAQADRFAEFQAMLDQAEIDAAEAERAEGYAADEAIDRAEGIYTASRMGW